MNFEVRLYIAAIIIVAIILAIPHLPQSRLKEQQEYDAYMLACMSEDNSSYDCARVLRRNPFYVSRVETILEQRK